MLSSYPTLNRRHFLQHVAGFSAGMALPGMQFLQQLRAAAPTLKKENKSLIILWMGGGPSTIDLWDLKPGSPNGGEFKPIKTTADGIEISEHLPTVASQFKHLSVIRSLVTNEGDHNRGTILMNTGRPPSPVVSYPHIGAVASSQLTPKELDLPGFISVGGTGERIGPGFLGMMYAPFTVQNPGQPPANIRPPNELGSGDLATERIRRRQRLLYTLEDNFINAKSGEAAQSHSDIYTKAFSLIVSPRGKVFDFSGEKQSLIDEYGNNQFGRGCLLARRLAEAGVTCIEVDLGGWDNHNGIFPILRNQRLPVLDKGMGTLVKDLVDRGMWENTVLVWMGEFGRTPRINQNAGRDHWARCWSVVVGGGAIKGGIAVGATDKDGTSVADRPVSIKELFATIYRGLGLDPKTQIRDNLGRPLGIADDASKAEPIKELV
ncbi:MAG: DUF1501 domain-containing protein [Gemmataceae bacterium]|nr:DUF1501 domain-containing protein [Gemmataceae bacterium]MDW8266774.1 DUF1501 domain-containing protein [Gemmataceae bacterium]